MSILTRLVLLVLLAALPVIGIQAYNEASLRRTGDARAVTDAQRLLSLIQDEQVRVVDGVREVLAAVAEAAPLIATSDAACQDYLDRLSKRLPSWRGFLMAGPDGVVRCATERGLIGLPSARMPHIGAALGGQPFAFGGYLLRRSDQRPVLPFAMPFYDAAGQVAGVVSMALDAGWVKDFLARKPLPDGASLVMADGKGVLLGRYPALAGPGIGEPLPESLMALVRSDHSGVAQAPGMDGTLRVFAYSSVGAAPQGLFLAVGIDRAAAVGAAEAAAARGAMLLLMEIALVLAAAWFGARAFVLRPLARLKHAVERLRAGDADARIGLPDDRSEIGGLARAFDAMAEELQSRQRARTAAHAAERRMAAILGSLTDAVLELDRDGRITFANDRARALFSSLFATPFADSAAMEGQRLVDGLPGTVAALFEERFRRVSATGQPTEFELWLGGPGTWHALRIFAIAGGRFAVYIQDVTGRKQDERALRRAEERHRSLLQTAADAIVLIDDHDTIRAFNAAAERIFGYPSPEAIGLPARVLVPGGLALTAQTSPDVAAPPDGAPETAPRAQEHGREVEGRRKDGARVPLEVALVEWHDGNERFVTAILRDITERKRADFALLKAKDQAERANLAKTRFLAAASHDLRQPVQSLFFFATALSDQIRGQRAARATLDAMQQAMDALKRLLDGLLDISKLDAGVVEPVSTTVPLQPMFDRIAMEYRPQIVRKGLDLRVVATSLQVRSDPMLLERVLRNLLDNALRYTREGRILLGARCGAGDVRLVVADSGIGIPPDQQEDIFEEFTQLDNPERNRERGLGLGLAIVRRLCRLLGHPVSLRSRPGRGSAFFVTVPRVEVARPAVVPALPAPPDPMADGGRRVVLVIDDEVIILMGLRAMLEGWGYDVIAATSGEEAIANLTEDGRRPDVVLADYRLRQGKTGPEALRAVHAHVGSPIPSIILTGDTAPERIIEAKASGFSILHKPVSAHHLRRVVGEAGGA